ncbi:MAG: hypothetical protein J0I90_01330, partial [Nitrosospira sp.]|nr:hypothetical protein [Nitrosospira sp.]
MHFGILGFELRELPRFDINLAEIGHDGDDLRIGQRHALGAGIKLVDFKVEFGRLWENDYMRIVLADEISPDSCRLWDVATQD